MKYNHISPLTIVSQKFDNPGYVRDRIRGIMKKPEMPPRYFKHRKPFNPAWMDYCDPYHCNDYHKTVCGLNRRKMKFKFFQSTCHLILNNQCSYFRGSLKYDLIDTHFCHIYVMFLRSGCPTYCHDKEVDPVCAVSSSKGQHVLFLNECAFDAANCRNGTMLDYEKIDMRVCEHVLNESENV
ncbi:uncharacterized protein LOC142985492 isoform X2 [Anticarsia gemmatalis]|uniref:uncharacterized protein LOC142985492 isoform X2 n=1 Tax=Anticarsia gemmatalis TaxID=129554 RepID=UPI003F7760F8